MKGMRKKKKGCNEPIFYKDLIFRNFQNNPNESAVIKKINHFLDPVGSLVSTLLVGCWLSHFF